MMDSWGKGLTDEQIAQWERNHLTKHTTCGKLCKCKTSQHGSDRSSQSASARFAQAKKKRNAKRLRKREKQAFLERITEVKDESPIPDRASNRAAVSGVKYDAITHYGGRCLACGETDYRILELDHVEGDGAHHRAVLVYGTARRGTIPAGGAFYARLRKLGFPSHPVLVVLCKSCHQTKTLKARMEGKNG